MASFNQNVYFDVLIIGAGPAGCQCARVLSKRGKKVLLIEKSKNFGVNNFSSAGAPLEIMQRFELPDSVVGRYWNKLRIASTNIEYVWEGEKIGGVVLDFMKLRTFLSEDAISNGCDVRMGWSYQSHRQSGKGLKVLIKNLDSHAVEEIETHILVDATGNDRAVIAKGTYDKDKAVIATGVEYLVEVNDSVYEQYDKTLNFFFGKGWMPQGYGWIFPMADRQLKVGVCRYFMRHQYVPHDSTFKGYLQNIMEKRLKNIDWPILDRHGKTIHYTYRQKDPYYLKNIVGIGDAVSMINPIAGEGIRHAMVSANFAAEEIENCLEKRTSTFQKYKSSVKRYCGMKWFYSEIMMHQLFKQPDDRKLDCTLKALMALDYQEMIDLTFYYKMRKIVKFFMRYMVELFIKRN